MRPRISAGSGFVIDAGRGLVVTNAHVVANARAVEVTIGERRVPARLVGADRATNIALLQIPAEELQ
ncbi:MAG: trypsin-like peptidase domain-containing protein, partial [Allosphingosinicella sp.]